MRRFFITVMPRIHNTEDKQNLLNSMESFFIQTTISRLNLAHDTIPEIAQLYAECAMILSPPGGDSVVKLAQRFQKKLKLNNLPMARRTAFLEFEKGPN